MDGASLTATLVVVFRETLEAGLIVGIILTLLSRLHAMRYARDVWVSVVAAIGASVAVGWALSLATQHVQGRWETIIEGVISLAACGVLTWMVFWMDRQAKRLRPDIEHQVEGAVSRQERVAMIALPFLAVFREGAETVLFLKAVAFQSGSASWMGGLLGGGAAVAVTAAIFVGGRKVPLKLLFRSTGVLLLFIGAGLLAYGIHELEELGWVPSLIAPVWNMNHILNEKVGLGSFLKALFGYNGNPSLTEVVAYGAYILLVIRALRRSTPPPTPPSSGHPALRPGTTTRPEPIGV